MKEGNKFHHIFFITLYLQLIVSGFLVYPALADVKDVVNYRGKSLETCLPETDSIVKPYDEFDIHLISYKDIRNWKSDDHTKMLEIFKQSCSSDNSFIETDSGIKIPREAWMNICHKAAQTQAEGAISFFEDNLSPVVIVDNTDNTLTGYYEPVLLGSWERNDEYRFPIYAIPKELSDGNSRKDSFYTRKEIDQGSLSRRGLELLYLNDRVELFFLHIQGSGVVDTPDGFVRVGFAGKNGHPYKSIGKWMLKNDIIPSNKATSEDMKTFLRNNPDIQDKVFWINPSYIFFRVLEYDMTKGPVGAQGIPLSPMRSVAIDHSYYSYGVPLWIIRSDYGVDESDDSYIYYDRMVIAQDTGSAIIGSQRADLFWGTGGVAGKRAGSLKQGVCIVSFIPVEIYKKVLADG